MPNTRETRLINAFDLVIKLAKKVGIMVRNGKPQAEIYSKVLECIADASTVDAVEVVRCKECRSWERNIPNRKEYGTCYCAGFSKGVEKHENGYCEKGKRRNDHEKE